MPLLTRWTIKTALLYLVMGMVFGMAYIANLRWGFWQPLFYLNPVYIHLIVVGWLTQLIFGVIYWMFPIISRDNMRGDPRLAWSVFIFLNVGLLFRAVFEPWQMMEANDLNSIGLMISAILQVIAGYLFILVCWPRVRRRAGA